MADKEIKLNFTETGVASYCIIKQESSGNVYDQNDGQFRSYGTATDPHLDLTEHTDIKGLYEVTVSAVFSDGRYTISAYKQAGGSPAPASDTVIGSGDLYILDDAEVILDDSLATVTAKTDSLTFTGTDVHSTLDGEQVSLQTATQNSIDAIETDTNEIQGKLPTNNIMGSSVKTDKDDEIDAIKSVTDNLPDSGALTTLITHLTDIKGAGWVDENITTIDTVVDAIKAVTDNLPNSGALTDLAVEANVETHVTNSLNSYDPPTRTELTSDKNEIITEVDANETKIDSLDTQVKRILGLLHENVKYTSPTYDSDGNLEQVTITIYTDNTLTTSLASYTWTATGNGAGKFSVAQQVKV